MLLQGPFKSSPFVWSYPKSFVAVSCIVHAHCPKHGSYLSQYYADYCNLQDEACTRFSALLYHKLQKMTCVHIYIIGTIMMAKVINTKVTGVISSTRSKISPSTTGWSRVSKQNETSTITIYSQEYVIFSIE